MEKIDLIPGWSNFCIGSDLFLDIIIEMKGLENYTFEDCFQMASEAEIEQIPIPFLHLNHLIQNKKITNRFNALEDKNHIPLIKIICNILAVLLILNMNRIK